jgi:4'-phosphopantetheinyl transferase
MNSSARPPREDTWQRYKPDMIPPADLETRVHVWRARLDVAAGAPLEGLAPDELDRAARFHAAGDRNRFTSARSILRSILASLMGSPERACSLRFGYAEAGKPFLIEDPKLVFNVSHSEDVVLVAVTRTGSVGVDIEFHRPVDNIADIARVAFDEGERAALMGCPPESRDAMFYRIWTRKEALLKAMGVGFSGLNDPRVIASGQSASGWCFSTIPHIDGYAAALARPRAAHGLTLWSWPNAFDLRAAERRIRPRAAPSAPRNLRPAANEVRP